MSQPKTKKGSTPWVQCQSCAIHILHKDEEIHSVDCPPNLNNKTYNFIKDGTLFGNLDVKVNEEIKVEDKDVLVFLSEAAIRLCSLAIGDWGVIEVENKPPIAKIVWPTSEKSLTSVLMTKNAQELAGLDINTNVKVSRCCFEYPEAKTISLVVLNGPKTMEINAELTNRIHKAHLNRLLCKGNKLSIRYFGKLLKFEIKIVETKSEELSEKFKELSMHDLKFARVADQTSWKLYGDEEKFSNEETNEQTVESIGGLSEEITEIRESIKMCFDKTKTTFGLKTSKSILLYGNSGTGKTLIANALARESKAHLIQLCASDLYSKSSNNVEDTIKNVFEEVKENSPSILVLDEVDILCPARSQRLSDTDKRIVSTLLSMFDSIRNEKHIFILGTTNKIDAIDPVFRRCGRFDREIEIPTPNPKNRYEIISKLLIGVEHSLTVENITEISQNTHGFVGADLVSLLNRAALTASRNNSQKISYDDFKNSLKFVRPSAMREVQVEVANVRWSDIGGQEHLKLILRQAVEWPLKHSSSFLRLGVTPPKGVLMFGPPGCSKTMIAKALATESGLNFLSIKGPELFSKWVGESEKAVREVFRKARQVAPSIVFFDEIDALGGERSSGSSTSVQERVLAQLLTELDGVSPLGDVTVVAATNRPDRIDKALLRPGRLDRIVYVPLPDERTRAEIFKIKLKKMPVRNVNIDELVKKTDRYSGAEVNAVCHEAAMMALEDSLDAEYVDEKHFEKALQLITPRTPPALVALYEEYLKK